MTNPKQNANEPHSQDNPENSENISEGGNQTTLTKNTSISKILAKKLAEFIPEKHSGEVGPETKAIGKEFPNNS